MPRNRFYIAILLIPTFAFAQDDAKLAPVAHLLDSQTLAVVRVDLAKIDVPAAVVFSSGFAGREIAAGEVQEMAQRVKGFVATLQEYGGQEVFVIVSLADVPESPPVIALSLKAGANVELIKKHLEPFTMRPLDQVEKSKDALVFGTEKTIARLRENKPVARPDLAAALANAGTSPVQVAAALPADAQRVIREMVDQLPPEIGGGAGKDLLAALQWTSLAIDTPPKIGLKWTIQSKTEADAAALRPRILAAINLAGKEGKLPEIMPDFADLAIRLTPAVKGNRLELNLAGTEAEAVVKQLKEGPLKLMRASAARASSMNNLKQIALAMHIYHDVYRKFPAAATLSKEGKPLLSWRVQILPYIEQMALYDQFKHDEPWDSEHNRQLIDKMPRVFLDPALPQLAKDGKTTYVVPVGEKSPFGGKEGIFLAKITDGTSNTILAVDVAPENAVVWTKPDDWSFNPEKPGAGLLDGKRKGFLASFCDGSVRNISADIDLSDLRRLVQMNDGEVLSKQY
jgi:hypothetical protein